MAETRTALNAHTETQQGKPRVSGLEFQRRFTDGKTSPFDKVEWERRTALIGNEKGQVIFRQENVEVPKTWSHDGDEHRCLEVFSRQAKHPRTRNLRTATDRPRSRYDCALGRRGRLLRERRIEKHFPRRTDAPAGGAEGGIQFAGVVQRRRAAQAAVLGVLHQLRPGQHGLDHEPGEDRGHAVQVGLGHGNQFLLVARQPRNAFGRRHRFRSGELHEGLRRVCGRDQERRKDAPRRQDGDPERGSSGYRGIHRVQNEGRAQGARADRARATTRRSTARPTLRCFSRTRTTRYA